MIYTPDWVSRLQDLLSIPTRWIVPLFSLQWGFGPRYWPNPFKIRVLFFHDTPSLYMNGIVFFGMQIALPLLPLQAGLIYLLFLVFGWHWWFLLFLCCFVNFMFRWGNENVSPAYLQTHIGWRPVDGAPVIVFRVQSDASAQGGLVLGFEDGGK